jgi:hypothetical protein
VRWKVQQLVKQLCGVLGNVQKARMRVQMLHWEGSCVRNTIPGTVDALMRISTAAVVLLPMLRRLT